jgi:hypothetical protein
MRDAYDRMLEQARARARAEIEGVYDELVGKAKAEVQFEVAEHARE